jgi:hypothetical protein
MTRRVIATITFGVFVLLVFAGMPRWWAVARSDCPATPSLRGGGRHDAER